MKDILKRWYEDDLSPREEIVVGDLEYNALYARLEQKHHQFFALLSPEQQEQLNQITEDMYSLSDKKTTSTLPTAFVWARPFSAKSFPDRLS